MDAVETRPEYGIARALVVAVVANVVDEDVGGCAGAAPEVGEIARFVCGRLRGAVCTGGYDIGSGDGAIFARQKKA